MGLRQVLGSDKIALMRDDAGICVHIMHRANSAQVLGTREISPEALSKLVIANLEPFQAYVSAASGAQRDREDSYEDCNEDTLAEPLIEVAAEVMGMLKVLGWRSRGRAGSNACEA